MRYRLLGSSGLRVSELFLGAMTFGEGGVGAPIATPSQVAIAWTMAHSDNVHPIMGARRLGQLVDNLGALDCVLSRDIVDRLDKVSAYEPGFPTDFIDEVSPWVLGDAGLRVTGRGARR